MPKYGMDTRIISLLVSSDYSTLPLNKYSMSQTSMGERAAEIIYEALSEESFKVSFNATIYETTNELVRIAAHLMFGSEMQFSYVRYNVEGDLCSLGIGVKRCPICEYLRSNEGVCNLLLGFFGRLVELFLSRFAEIKVESIEESCIAAGSDNCSFLVKWRTPIGLPPPKKQEIEIRIDNRVLQEKLREIENLDIYKKAVAYARQRRGQFQE